MVRRQFMSGGKLSGGQPSRRQLSWSSHPGAIIWGAIVHGEISLEGNCPRTRCIYTKMLVCFKNFLKKIK